MLVKTKEETSVVVNMNDYSKLQRLVCVTAKVRWFLNNLKASLKRKEIIKRSGKLEVSELKEARIKLIKLVQNELKNQSINQSILYLLEQVYSYKIE